MFYCLEYLGEPILNIYDLVLRQSLFDPNNLCFELKNWSDNELCARHAVLSSCCQEYIVIGNFTIFYHSFNILI